MYALIPEDVVEQAQAMTDLEEFVRFIAQMETPTERAIDQAQTENITADLGEARLLKNDAETLYALIREAPRTSPVPTHERLGPDDGKD